MTKEPIMIDDVDVAECDFLAKEDDYNSYSGVTYAYKGQCGCSDEEMCKDHPNCFYKKALKQLRRKEQECEELKTMLKDLSYESQKFCYQIEEQTKQLEPFKDEYFKGLDNVVIAELAKKSIRITAENRKLEQTLTEIKEFAEHFCSKHCPNFDDEECEMCIEDCILDEIVNPILQKISEVGNKSVSGCEERWVNNG